MALCSNSTSLLELAFGVNAVYTVLASQVSNVRTQIADITIANFKTADSNFDVEPTERLDFESWISLSFTGFKIANRARHVPQVLSVAFMLTAAGTLYQNAIWEKCVISDTTLGIFTFSSLILAPLFYFSFGAFLRYLVKSIATLSFKDPARTLRHIASYRKHLIYLNKKKITDAIYSAIKDKEGKRELLLLMQKISLIVHPIKAIKIRVRQYKNNKTRKSLMPKKPNP